MPPMHYTERIEAARATCARAASTESLSLIPYPWNELERDAVRTSGRIPLIGYGSLLNPDSARRTIRDTPPEGHTPIIGIGAHRVFNYVMPQTVIDRYGALENQAERAALNAVWTGRPDDVITGRLVNVSIEDLPALRERERGYHLGPVYFTLWNDPQAEPELGFVLVADDAPVDGVVHTDPTLLPHVGYTQLCIDGAAMVDHDFERALRETTVLGDGETRFDSYWLRRNA